MWCTNVFMHIHTCICVYMYVYIHTYKCWDIRVVMYMCNHSHIFADLYPRPDYASVPAKGVPMLVVVSV